MKRTILLQGSPSHMYSRSLFIPDFPNVHYTEKGGSLWKITIMTMYWHLIISIPQITFSTNMDPAENIENIYKAVHKYLAPGEEKGFQQMMSAINTMKSMREMQQMMELIQSLNPDMDPGAMAENLASENANMNGMNLNEILKMFGGNSNGNK